MASVNTYPYAEEITQNIEIDGFPFTAESISPNEAYSRRDLKRTKILNGGEVVTQGDFIPRDFTFTSKLRVRPDNHDMYDNIFQNMVSKPCEVVCRDMGPIFNAQVTIKKSPTTGDPTTLTCEVQVVEICNTADYFPDFTTNTEIVSITSGSTSTEDKEAAKASTKKKSDSTNSNSTSTDSTESDN